MAVGGAKDKQFVCCLAAGMDETTTFHSMEFGQRTE